ncbi:MAG: ribonuclease III [Defluviitaleaceae bacterium]|nr:ribonuclease III [Defluviitaleaceae bacterium]
MNVEAMNGSMLAFVGDAYYDLKIREMLIRRGINKSKKFHESAVFYVSAKAQSKILQRLIDEDYLTDEELVIVRRGRNVKSGTVPKNTDVIIYRQSTAFEALIGFLYLTARFARLDEVVLYCIEIRGEDEAHV